MTTPPFANPPEMPRLADGARATRVREAVAAAAQEAGLGPILADALSAPGVAALCDGVFSASPYLGRLAIRDAPVFVRLLREGPQAILDAVHAAFAGAWTDGPAELMAVLRAGKRHAALAIAFADAAGLWPLPQVTGALSALADHAVQVSVRALLGEEAEAGRFAPADRDAPDAGSGLIVLAMGKHGAHELNYSSDIDLVVFYDRDVMPCTGEGEAAALAIRVTRGLVKLLSEVTADGYVFRTDLRLRPDAGSTQIAVSTVAAETYYEALGQNWERAAFIKARPCAGDIAAGEAFLELLTPFVYRKYLDYAAIEDIHSIKRQIHAHGGHGEVAVRGHDIKLGRGGIREIEFFAQTQQLIAGGRDPALRVRATEDALAALTAKGMVSAAAAGELREAYRYLRRTEHRVQMIEDQQTHRIPAADAAFETLAAFLGHPSTEDFTRVLTGHLRAVERHYAQLFEAAPPLAGTGNLVFTGVENDPGTVATIAAMGFARPEDVAAAIRGWHHGRIRATRSSRAREMLTELTPALLAALAATPDPDLAFRQFDRFLSGLPSGVQLFSLLHANPALLGLLARALGTAPRLADYLARHPAVLDGLLEPEFLDTLPGRETLDRLLAGALETADGLEDAMNAVRRFVHEQSFRIGLQVILGAASAERAGPAFSGLAEAAIAALLPFAEADVASRHGHVPGGAVAVIAMGKLGGREMTAASDIDLLILYDHDQAAEQSDGERPLAPAAWFARLTQRLIAGLSALTSEGGLYEVDMRLRPSGNQGPVAVRLDAFRRYHAESAWTWEHLALTRARAIAGNERLRRAAERAIREVLARPRDRARTLEAVREMRGKLAAEHARAGLWDLKHGDGGLMALEFAAQTLQLLWGRSHPEVLRRNTWAAIAALERAGALKRAEAARLAEAAALFHDLTQVLSLTLDGPFQPETAPEGLKRLVAKAAKSEHFAEAEARLAETRVRVASFLDALLAR